MAAIDHHFRYVGQSQLQNAPGGQILQLVAEGSKAPCFFDGLLTEPAISAMCLRAVSEVVAKRFYVAPAMLARILREADPVATVAPDMVRFEGFSGCCSTYIRHDIGAAGFDADTVSPGTVNVDFRDQMRGALAQVRDGTALRLSISADAVGVTTDDVMVTEEKVPLPLRWVKGFAEVQTHMAGMDLAFCLPKVAAQRFLRDLPRAPNDHAQWVAVTGNTARLSAREVRGAVRIKGTQRLHILQRLATRADALHVYHNAAQGSSAWLLQFGPQRLTLVLNSEPWRGFSGDGQLLSALAQEEEVGMAGLRAQLSWQSALSADTLAADCNLSSDQVTRELAKLASIGLVGFDLSINAYFHRVLPFNLEKVAQLNPRLKSAQTLVAAGAVTMHPEGGAEVKSADVVHRVRLHGGALRCTCPWFAKNEHRRGPCKHILAFEILSEQPHA